MSARFISAAFWIGPIKWGVLAAALFFMSELTYGQSVVMTIGSRHLDGGSYCEFNPGWGLEHEHLLYGFYRNSLCKGSVYLGARWQPFRYESWRFGFLGMGVTGYEDPVTLGAGMAFSYEPGEWGANLVWVPNKKGEFGNGVIALQVKRKW